MSDAELKENQGFEYDDPGSTYRYTYKLQLSNAFQTAKKYNN